MTPTGARGWRSAAVTVALGAIVLTAAACGGANGPQSSGKRPDLKLAYMGPLTGELASVGQGGREAVQLAIDEANARGDLPARLTLEVFDTQLDPAQAQALTSQVLAQENVVGVVGPLSSGEVKAAAPTLEEAGLAFVTVASNPDLSRQGWKAFHRLMANDETQGTELARYIAEGLDARRVAVVHDNSEYGKGLATVTRRALRERAVEVASEDVIDPKALDYSAAVNVVKARQPEVVFYGGYYPEAGRLIKQLRDAGVTATFVSGDASKDPGIAQGAGKAAERVYVTCACTDPSRQPDPAAQGFAAAYGKRFGHPPVLYSVEMYDGATVLIDAVRRGATTRAAVLETLKAGRVQGVTKAFSFAPDGEVGAGTVYVYELRGGQFEPLGTTTELAR